MYVGLFLAPVMPPTFLTTIYPSVSAGHSLGVEPGAGPEQTVILRLLSSGIRSSACVIRQTEC